MVDIVNLSAEPLGKLFSWLPHGLKAEKVVFLPDACPGKAPLPTGTAVLTRQADWRKYAISDCGCGMRLLRSGLAREELDQATWDAIADRLRQRKGGLGDLGGGNHFLDAVVSGNDGALYFLVHTGPRDESVRVDQLIDSPDRFDAEFERVVSWARDNREAIQECIEASVGPLELVLDLPHNTFEVLEDGAVVVRKGSVRVEPGDLNIIPAHMDGDAVLARATDKVTECLFSQSHGTGRTMSRSDAKTLADTFDFEAFRKRVLLPSGLSFASLRTEAPYAYRDLDECLLLLDGYLEEVDRLRVVAYMGHL